MWHQTGLSFIQWDIVATTFEVQNLVLDFAKKNTHDINAQLFLIRGSNDIHAPTCTWIKYTCNHISTHFYALILGVHWIFVLVAYGYTERV